MVGAVEGTQPSPRQGAMTTTTTTLTTSGAPMRVARWLHEVHGADGTPETIEVTLEEIGSPLRYEDDTVRRALVSLERAGALTVTRHAPFVRGAEQPAR